jgi:uncharacterized protein (DUF1499 family)
MKIMWTIYALLAVLVVIIIAVVVTSEDLTRPIDFTTNFKHNKPNQFLVCPENYCPDKPNKIAPVFNVPSHQLAKAFAAMTTAQLPKVKIISRSDDGRQITYLQRSPILQFPDAITVRFIPLNDKTSTLAIYSRSKYGRKDLGMNPARVIHWLQRLEEQVSKP